MNKAYSAILRIMSKIDIVGNDIKISGQKASYNALSEKAVLKVVRPLFIEEGLVYHPIEGHLATSGSISFVSATLRITHVESGDFYDIWSCGGGWDSQDKGPGKALTYTTKYGLLKTLMLRGEDDPDNTGSEHIDELKKSLNAARDIANSKVKEALDNKLIGRPEYNYIMQNILEAYNSKDPLVRLNAACNWLDKVLSKEITYKLEDVVREKQRQG